MDEPESNRRPATCVAALTAELPPPRNTFPRTSAYATAGPRAPDGTQTRTAAIRSTMLRIGACAGANPVRYRSGRCPCRASRHSALAPLSGRILSSDKDCPDASGCESVTRTRVICLCERTKQNAPGGDPGAFAFPGDRRDRSPQRSQSSVSKPSGRARVGSASCICAQRRASRM